MTDYTELIRSLRNCSNNRCTPCDCGWFNEYQVDESCKEIIMWKAAAAIEALQAQLPKRGKWISDRLVTTNGGTYGVRRCSACEAYYQDVGYGWNYCPNCGAKMEVQDDKA